MAIDKIKGLSQSQITSISGVPLSNIQSVNGITLSTADVTFTLDGVSTYTFIGIGRYELDPYGPHTLSFIIDSSNGTISSKTDNWGNSFNLKNAKINVIYTTFF